MALFHKVHHKIIVLLRKQKCWSKLLLTCAYTLCIIPNAQSYVTQHVKRELFGIQSCRELSRVNYNKRYLFAYVTCKYLFWRLETCFYFSSESVQNLLNKKQNQRRICYEIKFKTNTNNKIIYQSINISITRINPLTKMYEIKKV